MFVAGSFNWQQTVLLVYFTGVAIFLLRLLTQTLILIQLMGMQIIGVTNNLNFALNTNRLKMMTKTKTSRFSGIKFLWALPAVALLLFAFAEPVYKANNTETENSVSTLQQGEKEFVQSNNLSGKSKIAFTVSETGKVTNVRIVEQDSEEIGKAAATVVMNMKDWEPGKQRGKPVPVTYLLPVEFK